MENPKEISCLVIGGAGFIGSHFVDLLKTKNCKFAVVDDLSTGSLDNLPKGIEFYRMNILDYDLLDHVFSDFKPTHVVHLAAQINAQDSIKNPTKDALINIMGSINVFEMCLKYEVEKIVLASSAAVYGQGGELPIFEGTRCFPISPYGLSKYTMEEYARMYFLHHNLNFSILRFANVYGPRQGRKGEGGVISILKECFDKGFAFDLYGDGEQSRDFVYVKDVVSAIWEALNMDKFLLANVSTSRSESVNTVISEMQKLYDRKLVINQHKLRKGDILRSCLDNSIMKIINNWKPQYTIQSGLFDYIKNYEQQSRNQLHNKSKE